MKYGLCEYPEQKLLAYFIQTIIYSYVFFYYWYGIGEVSSEANNLCCYILLPVVAISKCQRDSQYNT